MKKLFERFLMISGMALSFGAGFLVAKKKFDDLNDTQIEEIRQMYEAKYNKPQEERTQITVAVSNTNNPNSWTVHNYGGPGDMRIVDSQEAKEIVEYNYQNMIHIISPMEFGEDETYDTVGLTYYFDGTLARDDDDEVIDNIDDVIGINSLKYLGDYADGVLYIKNDITNSYYEITESDKTYTEVTGRLL